MSLETEYKVCGEKYSGVCLACRGRVKRVAELEDKIKKAIAVLDGGEGASGMVVRYAQEALKILLSKNTEHVHDKCCETCATTGLLCPIRNHDDEFTFPCPHWKAIE